jgi:hypothetical protein
MTDKEHYRLRAEHEHVLYVIRRIGKKYGLTGSLHPARVVQALEGIIDGIATSNAELAALWVERERGICEHEVGEYDWRDDQ